MKKEMIAKVLKELRKKNSLTVHDVVIKLSDKSINVADKTLYGWESGQAQPDADTLLVLCEIYHVDEILRQLVVESAFDASKLFRALLRK